MPTSDTIHVLARQAARWTTAAGQDESAFIENIHANYGVAYALALRDIATDGEIQQVTGLTGRDILGHAVDAQDRAAMSLSAQAPQIAPRGPLVALAKEGLPTGYGNDQSLAQRLSHGLVEGLGFGLGHLLFTAFLAGGVGFLGFRLGRGRNERTR